MTQFSPIPFAYIHDRRIPEPRCIIRSLIESAELHQLSGEKAANFISDALAQFLRSNKIVMTPNYADSENYPLSFKEA